MKVIERVTIYLLFICLCVRFYRELHDELNKQRLEQKVREIVLIVEYEKTLGYEKLHKFQESVVTVSKIQDIKRTIEHVNEVQHIHNNDIGGLNVDLTVLVIHVHHNITYLDVFLESILHVVGINRSLLVFAHDYYDEEINSAIRNIKCARVMQVFYPFSTQLHPNVYPGEDFKFCEELDQCYESRKRNPILVQTKLFWWWVTNQVFDHIGVLENYNGYIYFLESELYLASDFIDMAKVLEHVQALFCPGCQILSLGARPPGSDLQNNSVVKIIWGWSNYSNSGIGFNRTTWKEIKELKQHFCYFNDPSWEHSLKHLGTKTQQHQFFMLFNEAPRIFPTTGCGAFRNGTNCDLNCTYQDILKFVPGIKHGSYLGNFSLKLDNLTKSNEVAARGYWGDARDIALCIFFSGKGRQIKK